MARYFSLFPQTLYSISRSTSQPSNYQTVTNLLARVRVITEALSSVFHYYEYVVKDGETPETVATNFYDDPEGHWVVLLTNNIIDPQYDWPLNVSDFDEYITKKYGSIEIAKTQVHHYEKLIKRVNVTTNETFIDTYKISLTEYNTLPEEPGSPDNTITISGSIINTYPVYRNVVMAYDWEFDANEAKRNIKIVKKEYYQTIREELRLLMDAGSSVRRDAGQRVLVR